jgi:dTDP-4-amino-4,6-dideoxygalactose transaminase
VERNELNRHLAENSVPSMIYYPVPLYRQKAFSEFVADDFELPSVQRLCDSVLSLPIHTEMDSDSQNYIIESVKNFLRENRKPQHKTVN